MYPQTQKKNRIHCLSGGQIVVDGQLVYEAGAEGGTAQPQLVSKYSQYMHRIKNSRNQFFLKILNSNLICFFKIQDVEFLF